MRSDSSLHSIAFSVCMCAMVAIMCVCACVCVLGGCTHMWMHVCNHSQTLNDIVGDLWREWQTHGYLGDAKIFTQRGKKKKKLCSYSVS